MADEENKPPSPTEDIPLQDLNGTEDEPKSPPAGKQQRFQKLKGGFDEIKSLLSSNKTPKMVSSKSSSSGSDPSSRKLPVHNSPSTASTLTIPSSSEATSSEATGSTQRERTEPTSSNTTAIGSQQAADQPIDEVPDLPADPPSSGSENQRINAQQQTDMETLRTRFLIAWDKYKYLFYGILTVVVLGIAAILLFRWFLPWVFSSTPYVDKFLATYKDHHTLPYKNSGQTPISSDLEPLYYNVSITTFMYDNPPRFEGGLLMLFRVRERTDEIVFHARDLRIDPTHIIFTGDQELHAKRIMKDNENDFFIIETSQDMNVNETYTVFVRFSSELSQSRPGLFVASYNDNDEKGVFVATQLQPAYARYVFPCMDEPRHKAKFLLNVVHPPNVTSVGNMPYSNQIERGNSIVDIYETTQKMSSYLLSFAVTNFVNKTKERVMILSTESTIDYADFALTIANRLLKMYEKYLNVPYTLSELKIVGLPTAVETNKENWGVILMNNKHLIMDSDRATYNYEFELAATISHELAHYWFGNLVTAYWWDEIWLHEGFVTYFQYVMLDEIDRKYLGEERFITNELFYAFSSDALSETRPVVIPVGKPSKAFHEVVFTKASSIIRMVALIMGESSFRTAMTSYLNNFKYKSVCENDLWNELEKHMNPDKLKSNGRPIKLANVMYNWIHTKGYPVITFERNYSDKTIVVTQKRYRFPSDSKIIPPQSWWVPITFTSAKDMDFSTTQDRPVYWLGESDDNIKINVTKVASNEFIIGNIRHAGFYRMNYDVTNWRSITKFMKNNHKKIPTISRAQLIDDALNLARSGELSYEIALNFLGYMIHERDYLPWRTLVNNFALIDTMLEGHPDYHKFNYFFTFIITPAFMDMGFYHQTSDTAPRHLSRSVVIEAACYLGLPNCLLSAMTDYSSWMTEKDPDIKNPVEPNDRDSTYCTAIRNGGLPYWRFALTRYNYTDDEDEKASLTKALTCSNDGRLLRKLLENVLNSRYGFSHGDLLSIHTMVATQGQVGRKVALDFLIDNYKTMRQTLGYSKNALAGVLVAISRTLSDRENYDRVLKIVSEFLSEVDMSFVAVENIENNLYWMEKRVPTLMEAVHKFMLANDPEYLKNIGTI